MGFFLGNCYLKTQFAVSVNQWVIYDAYVSYEYQKELQDEKERLRGKKEDHNQVWAVTPKNAIASGMVLITDDT